MTTTQKVELEIAIKRIGEQELTPKNTNKVINQLKEQRKFARLQPGNYWANAVKDIDGVLAQLEPHSECCGAPLTGYYQETNICPTCKESL